MCPVDIITKLSTFEYVSSFRRFSRAEFRPLPHTWQRAVRDIHVVVTPFQEMQSSECYSCADWISGSSVPMESDKSEGRRRISGSACVLPACKSNTRKSDCKRSVPSLLESLCYRHLLFGLRINRSVRSFRMLFCSISSRRWIVGPTWSQEYFAVDERFLCRF